jgi:hypothetical protein
METLIHIVFDDQGAENLRQSFAMDDLIQGRILTLADDLAFGPLDDSRQQWWDGLQAEGATYEKTASDAGSLTDIAQQMREDPNNEIWIWAAQNARDVSGYYGLMEHLEDFLGRVHLIYLNNLPFINEKGGIFYPRYLSEILPREFLKARKLAREITAAEWEIDGEDWRRLKEEGSLVRILEGGKRIRGEGADFFDKELLNRCRLDYQKGWRLVNQLRSKLKDHVDEAFLYSRLQELLASGQLAAKEAYKNTRDAEVKAAGGESEPENEPQDEAE